MTTAWPTLDYEAWRPTHEALHRWLQIVGKYRLAVSPWVNHSWHATLYVTPRGWTTGPLYVADEALEISFDVRSHRLILASNMREDVTITLEPMSVATFHERFVRALSELGVARDFHGTPNEMPDPVPFVDDIEERPYDRELITRHHRAMLDVDRVFRRFRTSYLAKVSPVHLFWGSFDLAVTRFSGRMAPRHPGGIPALPDDVTREAYSHEVSSAGFWLGGGGVDEAAFYSYAYPGPEGFSKANVRPPEASWHEDLGEFVLPYHAVRSSGDPDAMLMAFLETTWEAASTLGGWSSMNLECDVGEPRRVRRWHVPEDKERPDLSAMKMVRREGEEDAGRYVLGQDGVASVTFRRAGERLVLLEETHYDPDQGSPDAAEQLAHKIVEDARSRGDHLVALCPYIRALMGRHPEWRDVVQT